MFAKIALYIIKRIRHTKFLARAQEQLGLLFLKV